MSTALGLVEGGKASTPPARSTCRILCGHHSVSRIGVVPACGGRGVSSRHRSRSRSDMAAHGLLRSAALVPTKGGRPLPSTAPFSRGTAPSASIVPIFGWVDDQGSRTQCSRFWTSDGCRDTRITQISGGP
ncbi:hypothetical protein NDU88_006627 [Pleurodeles waltl]|uniref:Uncharacterized protein n=1 Tax=Pleurodeles waltl TaxID=8319 RepID=A0AAV7WE57_PLEWA|nr:hypothetical protein NDU88_006627 [Pleurodeles waltl]